MIQLPEMGDYADFLDLVRSMCANHPDTNDDGTGDLVPVP